MYNRVEEYLLESRLNFTILQPTHFMQNIPLSNILQSPSSELNVGYNPNTLQGFVSLDDFATVVTKVVDNPEQHNLARYELVGENKSHEDCAKVVGGVIGRDISCVQISFDQAVKNFQSMGQGIGEWSEDGVRRLLFYYDRW